MNSPYQHWDDALTVRQLFGDTAAVCDLVNVFLAEYQSSLDVLMNDQANLKQLSDEVHGLRSLFGIFNATTGHVMAVDMDRDMRADRPVSAAARQQLASEMQAFARELQHFLTVHQP